MNENHYPDLAGRIFVINGIWLVILFIRFLIKSIFSIKKAPKIIGIAYQLMRPFISERSAKKMQIYSHDSAEECKKVLLTYIDADQLPACYGGTMTDPDGNPNCITKVLNKSHFDWTLLLISCMCSVQYGRTGTEIILLA